MHLLDGFNSNNSLLKREQDDIKSTDAFTSIHILQTLHHPLIFPTSISSTPKASSDPSQ